MPVAHAPTLVPTVEVGEPPVPEMEDRRDLEGPQRYLADTLRERLRLELGRHPEPSARVVDSQSAKTTGVGGEARGFDGGKRMRGRKRHLLVDTEGPIIEARVHSAKVPDRDGIRLLLEPDRERLPRLLHLWVDQRVTRDEARSVRSGRS